MYCVFLVFLIIKQSIKCIIKLSWNKKEMLIHNLNISFSFKRIFSTVINLFAHRLHMSPPHMNKNSYPFLYILPLPPKYIVYYNEVVKAHVLKFKFQNCRDLHKLKHRPAKVQFLRCFSFCF